MEWIIGSEQFPHLRSRPAITMGNFDGVHRGHQTLIAAARLWAEGHQTVAVAYTFAPHPVQVLAPAAAPLLLQTADQKRAALTAAGIDLCVVEPFTVAFARLEPATFFRNVIEERLHAAALIVGYDFTFGLHRRGKVADLKTLAESVGIETIIIEPQFVGETLVSSSQIRRLVREGHVTQAAELLGRPYEIVGRVVRGRGLGATLGAHTANLESENELLPGDGIYLTTTALLPDHGPWSSTLLQLDSVTSIGWNPTFPGSVHTVETHIIGREIDVRGQRLAVEFLHRLRDEIAFETPEALKRQIAADIVDAQERHAKRHR